MQALCFHGERDVRVEDVPDPAIVEPEDVLVRVTTTAVCGTDLHIYHDKLPGVSEGSVIGHEFAGVVEEVGSAVREFGPGDRCVASMYTACGRCPGCLSGEHRRCFYFSMFGMGAVAGDLEGGQAEYVRVPLGDMTLTAIPEALSDEDVLFVGDILATAYTGLRTAQVRHGDTVAVVGAGPLGQLVAMCAPLFGASQVLAVDLVPDRLDRAAALGAIPIAAGSVDPVDAVLDVTGNHGADVVVECVGSESGMGTAFNLARVGGRVALLGVLVEEEWPISAGEAFLKGLSIHGVIGNPFAARHELVGLIERGRLDPKQVISHRLPLKEAEEAYRLFDRREASKVVLTAGS